jgi:ubiquinone/menaquinone biosynthesis C-methylase UbiE
MRPHVCPWWGGYFIDNRLRRWLHNPDTILAPYLDPGMVAVDFGCGMGIFALAMARLVGEQGRVIAIDLQQQMLNVLAKRARKTDLARRIQTHRCEVTSLKLERDLAADFALMFYSAHEVPDPQQLFVEMHDNLRPGAHLLIVEPVGHVTATHFQRLLHLARAVGMQVVARPRVRWSHAALLVKDPRRDDPAP